MPKRIPKLCGPRADGRYYVRDPRTGLREYLGYDRQEAEQAYEAWRLKFLSEPAPVAGCTVVELTLRFLAHAEGYYRKNNALTSEYYALKTALACLEPFGRLELSAFGPAELKAARAKMLELGWSRRYINQQVDRVCRVWRWAVAEQLVDVSRLQALETVAPLRKGRTPAREQRKIPAVPVAVVEATLPHFRRRRLALLVQVHLASGMRAEEVVALRPCDLDVSGVPWIYRVPEEAYKLAHQERAPERRVPIGPRGRAALEGLLAEAASPTAWLFPSWDGRRSRKKGALRQHITVRSYSRACGLACRRLFVERIAQGLEPLPAWTPLQLRHRALTDIRARYGLEGAAVIAGHGDLQTTTIYAEKNWELARRVAEEMG